VSPPAAADFRYAAWAEREKVRTFVR